MSPDFHRRYTREKRIYISDSHMIKKGFFFFLHTVGRVPDRRIRHRTLLPRSVKKQREDFESHLNQKKSWREIRALAFTLTHAQHAQPVTFLFDFYCIALSDLLIIQIILSAGVYSTTHAHTHAHIT